MRPRQLGCGLLNQGVCRVCYNRLNARLRRDPHALDRILRRLAEGLPIKV